MPARITVYLMMNDEQFNATKDSAIAGADLMGTHIGGAAKKGAKDAEGAMQNLSHKMGSIFSSIGSGAASMGLPFASTFSKMGSQLSATTGKAEGLKMMMASIGKISLGVGIAGIAAGAVVTLDWRLPIFLHPVRRSLGAVQNLIDVAIAGEDGAALLIQH